MRHVFLELIFRFHFAELDSSFEFESNHIYIRISMPFTFTIAEPFFFFFGMLEINHKLSREKMRESQTCGKLSFSCDDWQLKGNLHQAYDIETMSNGIPYAYTLQRLQYNNNKQQQQKVAHNFDFGGCSMQRTICQITA